MEKRFMIKAFISNQVYYAADGFGKTVVWTEKEKEALLFGTEEAVEQFAFLNLKTRRYRYEILRIK